MIKKAAKGPVIVIARYTIRHHTRNDIIAPPCSKESNVFSKFKAMPPKTKTTIENIPNPTILKTPLLFFS